MRRNRYSGALARRYGGAMARRCGGALIRRYSDALVRRYGGALARRYGGALARRYGGALVRRYSDALVRRARWRAGTRAPCKTHSIATTAGKIAPVGWQDYCGLATCTGARRISLQLCAL